jgi:hypothetical protein
MDKAHISHDSENWPAWGSLPLDLYMISQWTEDASIPDDQQRLQIVRNYVSSGRANRAWYAEQVKQGQNRPTTEQVSRILEPFRAPALRYVAERLSNDCGNFVWLRTDYDHEEQRKALIQKLTSPEFEESNWAEYLYEGEIILSDRRYYNVEGEEWKSVLDILPEIIDHKMPDWPGEYHDDIKIHQQRVKRDYMEWDQSYYYEGKPDTGLDRIIDAETVSREQAEAWLFRTRIVDCHSISCETILFVEDAETHTTEPATFHALWLDDRAVVVRHTRATLEEACDISTDVEKSWEDTCFLYADVGSDYARGGVCGPPYTMGPSRDIQLRPLSE